MAVRETSASVAAQRMKICKGCHHYVKDNDRCRKMPGKMQRWARVAAKKCQIRAWEKGVSIDPRDKSVPPNINRTSFPSAKRRATSIMLGMPMVSKRCGSAIKQACRVHQIDLIIHDRLTGYVANLRDHDNVMTWGLRDYDNAWYVKEERNFLFIENGLLGQNEGCWIDPDGYFVDSRLCRAREFDLDAAKSEIDRLTRLCRERFGWDLFSDKFDKDGPILFCAQLDPDAPCQRHFPARVDGLDTIASALKLMAQHAPDRPIIIRPHPRGHRAWDAKESEYREFFRPNWTVEKGGKVYDTIKRCSAVITINSTVATEAMTLGIPVATLGESAYTGSGATLECAKAPERLETLYVWGNCEGCQRAELRARQVKYLAAVLRHQVPYDADVAGVLANESFKAWVNRNNDAVSPTAVWMPPKVRMPEKGIPKILHFIWIGGKLPNYAEYNIAKWREMNPEYITMLHGEEILHDEHRSMYKRLRRYDHWADVLKWSALRTYGGWTIDADTVPLRPMSTFTETLHPESDFIAVQVPPKDERRGMTRCDMGFLGATPNARIWPKVEWFLNGNTGEMPRKGRALGGIRCMDYLLGAAGNLITRQSSRLYCPYSRRDKVWIPIGKAYFKALRAGQDVSDFIEKYNTTFGNPLGWHLWRTAV